MMVQMVTSLTAQPFLMYVIVKSLCHTPEANKILHVSIIYILIKTFLKIRVNHGRKKNSCTSAGTVWAFGFLQKGAGRDSGQV